MLVENRADCIRAYCYTCHGSGYEAKSLPLSERIANAAARKADDEARTSVRLPPDSEPSVKLWPAHARLWLYKAGLGAEDIQRLGFVYSKRMGRVVMPVRNDRGEVVFWQARGFRPGVPKYLSPSVDRSAVIPKYGTPNEWVVLTEDILSAAKVGQVAHAWSMMGTQLRDGMLLELLRLKHHVIIALDPDAPGRRGAGQTMQKLAAFGIRAVSITSLLTQDPKNYSRDEIKELLKDATCL